MRHVILGAGPAGVIAAETIRKHAPHDSIVLVGDEPEAPFGSAKALCELADMTAKGVGFGKELGQGSKRLGL